MQNRLALFGRILLVLAVTVVLLLLRYVGINYFGRFLIKGTSAYLANLGTYLLGIGVIWGVDQFREHWRIQRSNAAIIILALFKHHIWYISEIMIKPGLFQAEGYYPDRMPEVGSSAAAPSKGRAVRLINNKIGEFHKGMNKQIVRLPAKQFIQMQKLADDFVKRARRIAGDVQGKVDEYEKEVQLRLDANREEHEKALSEIQSKAEQVLKPLIKGEIPE
jgi:gas vesicle protein